MPSSSPEIQKIAELLAKRAAVVRMVPPSELKKQAMNQPESNWLAHLGQMAKVAEPAAAPKLPMPDTGGGIHNMKPWKTGLLGGGIGAALGGLGGLLTTGEEEEEHKWRNAMTGALAGGALGGGVGLAAPSIGRLYAQNKAEGQLKDLQSKSPPASAVEEAIGAGGSALIHPSIVANALYHGNRSIPGLPGSRMIAPEAIIDDALKEMNQGGAANSRKLRYIQETIKSWPQAPTPAAGAGANYGLAEARALLPRALAAQHEAMKGPEFLKGMYEREGKGPWMRKSLSPLVRMGGQPYHNPASMPARMRGGIATAGLGLLPFFLQKMEGKLPSENKEQIFGKKQELKDLANKPWF